MDCIEIGLYRKTVKIKNPKSSRWSSFSFEYISWKPLLPLSPVSYHFPHSVEFRILKIGQEMIEGGWITPLFVKFWKALVLLSWSDWSGKPLFLHFFCHLWWFLFFLIHVLGEIVFYGLWISYPRHSYE